MKEPQKPKWELSEASFKLLLDWLDPDLQGAVEKYEKIRRKMLGIFARAPYLLSDEMADVAFDRVARKVESGVVVPPGKREAYCCGVARLVLLEFLRRRKNTFDDVEWQQTSKQLVKQAIEEENAHGRSERMSDCLNECLRRLGPKDRELLLLYYGGDEPTRQRNRKELATRLELEYGNLRTRASRLRAKLIKCINDCQERNNAR